jgi:hypothetical protein
LSPSFPTSPAPHPKIAVKLLTKGAQEVPLVLYKPSYSTKYNLSLPVVVALGRSETDETVSTIPSSNSFIAFESICWSMLSTPIFDLRLRTKFVTSILETLHTNRSYG